MTTDGGAWRGKAEIAYAQLRADIESGALAPGRSLPEADLVAYTGASRTPVREAVRRLAAEGLVDLEPRRAPSVSRISLKSARALFDFRRLLEPEAIRLTAALASATPAVRDVFARLAERFQRLEGADHSPAFTDLFRELTAEFDAQVAAHTGNDYLSRAITDLRPHSTRLRYIAHSDTSRLQESVQEHMRMCHAIVEGASDEAAEAMTAHLNHVDQAIFRQLLGATQSGPDLLVG